MNRSRQELEFAMNKLALKPEDVVFVGTRGGKYGCTYDELIEIFDGMEYEDEGVRGDLVIVLKDNSYLYRQEGPYHDDNGYSYWEREYPINVNSSYTKLDEDSVTGYYVNDLEETDERTYVGYEDSWQNSCGEDNDEDDEDDNDEDEE